METQPSSGGVLPDGTVTSPAIILPLGAAGTPSLYFTGDTTTGWYRRTANVWSWSASGTGNFEFSGTSFYGVAGSIFGFSSGAIGTSIDVQMSRAAANSIRFSSAASTATARTELNSAIASIADAVATTCLTITVPNSAQSASIQIRVTGSLGAGGAIGANEATATNTYLIALTRTAGVNATAAISAAFGAAATAVAGAATVTCTAAMSAVSGAVGASNTFTVNVTVTRSGGASTNHTCLVYAVLMNANASGITIA
jgi:hypothetical protein